MKITAGAVLFFVCAPIVGVVLAAQGQQTQSAHEQLVFGEREPLRRPVPVSPEVLRVLLETREARSVLGHSGLDHPENVLRASEVHLGPSGDADLVVLGSDPLTGADNDWFWIVRSTQKGPKVILWSGCYELEILDTRTNGYRDIRSEWSSPQETIEEVYHFDGSRYRIWKKESQEHLGHGLNILGRPFANHIL